MNEKIYIETSLLFSTPLSRIAKTNIYLKLEALQPSGSFKNRGIGHFCSEMKKQGANKFISSSGGNAGLAASYASRLLSIPITVVVPESTPKMMIDKIKAENAQVIQVGVDWQEADQYARRQCIEQNATYVPPFDDPLIWSGNATIVSEVASSGMKPDAIVVSVSRGGLYCGLVKGLKNVGWENTPVFAVETKGAASFAAGIKAGSPVELNKTV